MRSWFQGGTPQWLYTVIVASGTLIAGSPPGAAQIINEYSLPSAASRPTGIAQGPDGAMWFTENPSGSQGMAQIGRITSNGAITQFPVSIDGQLNSITPRPNSALWFTGFNIPTGFVWSITTSGTVTTPINIGSDSRSGGFTTNITQGPNNTLWFFASVSGGNSIDEFSNGTLTQFSFFSLNFNTQGVQGLAMGLDGAMWFPVAGTAAIGRITTAGTITQFPIPASCGAVQSITAGPDGAMWFTMSGTNQIGRITTSGVVTEYAIPTPNSLPVGSGA
jgi:virginiamycin B lyase